MTPTRVAPDTLSGYVPLDALSRASLKRLAAKTGPEHLAAGQIVFRKGDIDRRHVFLLEGALELQRNVCANAIVVAGSPESHHAIAQRQPRPCTVRARTDSDIFRIDSQELDMLLTWDQSRGYDVGEIGAPPGDHEDWMAHLLQAPLFRSIAPTNIQAVFESLEAVDYASGECVVRQGDEGEYFYVVREGRCDVMRTTRLRPKGVHVAELGPGDTFGEEALIASVPRTANVTMRTAGTLMRLSKRDFLALLREPVLWKLDYTEALRHVLEGVAVWLDVRMPSEHQACRLPHSENIPLITLRMRLKSLDDAPEYVVYCDTGRRSAVASYILAERGFRAPLLTGGLSCVPPAALTRALIT